MISNLKEKYSIYALYSMAKKLQLPDVTLLAIDRHDVEGIKRSVDIATREIDFGEVVLITEHDYFRGREGYSLWCLTDMYKFVNTSHVLIIHSDGILQNPKAWDNSWLKLDLIGATWSYKDNLNVGNGGFSLRSKKLLDILGKIDYTGLNTKFEDCLISRYLRPWLEKEYGIKFATEEQANRFAIEAYGSHVFIDSYGHRGNTYTSQFGSHGYGILGLPHEPAKKLNGIQPVNNRRLIRK